VAGQRKARYVAGRDDGKNGRKSISVKVPEVFKLLSNLKTRLSGSAVLAYPVDEKETSVGKESLPFHLREKFYRPISIYRGGKRNWSVERNQKKERRRAKKADCD